MWTMPSRLRSHRNWIPAALAVLGLAAAAPAMSTASLLPSSPGAEMTLLFARPSARIVGDQALILVRCEGPRQGICNGTVTVAARGHRHREPFSLAGGTRQSLAVKVGARRRLSGSRARAIASTAQSDGGYVRSRETLRFR